MPSPPTRASACPPSSRVEKSGIAPATSREAADLLRAYLRIDTSNPPGNERLAAEFLQSIFDRHGIACRVFDQSHNRANILARLPGLSGKRPILLLSHLDVVPAEAARWTMPPFGGGLRDGKIWGRGATDMKGTTICHLMVMILLKRDGIVLDRDVLFLGTVDEEVGRENGLRWMLERHPDLLRDPEFALTEGGAISVREGRSTAWNVTATEKAVLWLRLTAEGPAGHGSLPGADPAISRLAQALVRISDYRPAPLLTPAVGRYFEQLASTFTDPLRADLSDPARALANPVRAARLLADPFRAACLCPTIAITSLVAGGPVNVIPPEASATIDCRLPPGIDPHKFLRELEGVIGDPLCRLEMISAEPSSESPLDTELFRALERTRDRLDPGVPILSPPLASSTDAAQLRSRGVVVYGFEPFRLTFEEDQSHGDDERLSLDNLTVGIQVLYELFADFAASRR